MSLIKLYVENPDKYTAYQMARPDYSKAVDNVLEFAKDFVDSQERKNVVVTDFCCGPGETSRRFADKIGGLHRAILIDKNPRFLNMAKNARIKASSVLTFCEDTLKVAVKKEADIVFAIFAYHHLSDDKKASFIHKLQGAIKENGILVVAEIYLPKAEIAKYYTYLYNSISESDKSSGLKEFLDETAQSSTEEFKVTKDFADRQFLAGHFKMVREEKIWPLDNSLGNDAGTYVQVFVSTKI